MFGEHWRTGRWTFGHAAAGLIETIDEIESSSPRVTIVVGTALIDDCLTTALAASSAIQQKTFINRCWGERGSIRDLSQKIDLAACFGIYGLTTHADLIKIRDMRNEAAHKARQRTFESAKIRGLCRDLNLPDWQSKRRALPELRHPRERFLAVVALLSDFLTIWANVLRSDPEKRPSVRLP